MGRPTDKDGLLDAARVEFDRLLDAVDRVPVDDRERPGACEQWSVKDLLAHLDAWHELFLTWEAAGSAGEAPQMPAPGYGWTDTPALNAAIQQRTADDAWDDVCGRLQRSHGVVLDVIAGYDNAELFTKRRVPWTGSTSIGSYATSATSSHYAWASKLIRRWARRSRR
jgi:hypothetical protein